MKEKQTVKELRKRLDLTQAQVAAKLKMPLSTYALMEKRGDFSEDELQKLAGILKISAEQISLPVSSQEGSADIAYIVNAIIKIEASQRVILRGLADVYSEQTRTSATKILSDYTKAVRDEISAIRDELKA